jgi:ATP-dependent Clp protease ATP-binding subunit ClpC
MAIAKIIKSARSIHLIDLSSRLQIKYKHIQWDVHHLVMGLLLEDKGIIAEVFQAIKKDRRALYNSLGQAAHAIYATKENLDDRVAMQTDDLADILDKYCFQEAEAMDLREVDPDHLLLGAFSTHSEVVEILLRNGITKEILVKAVTDIRHLDYKGNASPISDALALYTTDLTKLAAEGKLDPVIGRDEEIDLVISVLNRNKKNNPVLVGEPGVGKTAIVEGLAQRIYNQDNIPSNMTRKIVLTLDVGAVVAGGKLRGEVEDRIKAVINAVKQSAGQIILFVDELHVIVGAGETGDGGGIGMNNLMKPALARGELHCIGATTRDEYDKYILKDGALERRFEKVDIDEPNVEETLEMLRGTYTGYERMHGVRYDKGTIELIAKLSDKYIKFPAKPDSAFTVMDGAATLALQARYKLPPEIRAKKQGIRRLEVQVSVAQRVTTSSVALASELQRLNDEVNAEIACWRAANGYDKEVVLVTEAHVVQSVSKISGVPPEKVIFKPPKNLSRLEGELSRLVYGQPHAIGAVSTAIRRYYGGLGDPSKPIASLLFIGDPGVGKTSLAEALAEVVFKLNGKLVVLNMSDYSMPTSVMRMIGVQQGIAGAGGRSTLTDPVRDNPFTVVLFNEIELASAEARDLLLQITTHGKITDAREREVDFTNTVIIATTNVGGDKIWEAASRVNDPDELLDAVSDDLKKFFTRAWLDRFEKVVFVPLYRNELYHILSRERDAFARVLKETYNLTLDMTEGSLYLLVSKHFNRKKGARGLIMSFQRLIVNQLTNDITRIKDQVGSLKSLAGYHIYEDKEEIKIARLQRK